VPVVSFKTGCIPESVSDRQTGFLVQEKDTDGLAEAILELLNDQATWQKFSTAARPYVLQNFDLREQTKLLEEIYDEARAKLGLF